MPDWSPPSTTRWGGYGGRSTPPGTADEASEVTTYDTLGRALTRVDRQGAVIVETSTWTYDPPNGTGQVSQMALSDGSFTKTFHYDGLSRLERTNSVFTGLAAAQVIVYSYDVFSRDAGHAFPSGFSARMSCQRISI